MAKVSNVYSGEYISAAQLQGKGRVNACIHNASVEQVGQKQDEKIVLELVSTNGRAWPQKVVVNKTNALILSSAYGDDTDDWTGQTIEVWAEAVQFQGKVVQGIKLAPAVKHAIAAGQNTNVVPHQALPRATVDDLNDEIPF